MSDYLDSVIDRQTDDAREVAKYQYWGSLIKGVVTTGVGIYQSADGSTKYDYSNVGNLLGSAVSDYGRIWYSENPSQLAQPSINLGSTNAGTTTPVSTNNSLLVLAAIAILVFVVM